MRMLARIMEAIRLVLTNLLRLTDAFDEIKINQGRILTELHKGKRSSNLQDYEFGIFSQWGEDGIIQHLLSVIEIKAKTFIEFGVEDFRESNCRFLIMKDSWRGFVIDGSAKKIERLKRAPFFWKYDLAAINAFITRENINDLLGRSGFAEDLGILSIDLDGNDYHILEAIRSFVPRIIVCEYNAVFGVSRKITVPYEDKFIRTRRHFSNLYAGASLSAITHIAERKGYCLVGTNSAGNNAFFVRSDLMNEHLHTLSVEEAFTLSSFRESKDRWNNPTFIGGEARLDLIRGLPVLNVETGKIEPL